MLRDIPLREQIHFAAQERVVIGRQYARLRGFLPDDQGIYGLQIHVQWRRRGGVDALHHGLIAQVAEQHKALRLVPIEHLRAVDSSLLQQGGDFHKGRAVFFVQRRVHHDQSGAIGAVRAVQAQITPETGIGGRQAQAVRLQAKARLHRLQPSRKRLFTLGIGPLHWLQLVRHGGFRAVLGWHVVLKNHSRRVCAANERKRVSRAHG